MKTPSLRQRWLGEQLVELRKQAGLASIIQTASLIGRSPASLSRIENGAVAIPPRDLAPILDAYQIRDESIRDHLLVVAEEIQQERRGWWTKYGDLLPPSHIDLIRLEATATEILTFQIQVIPDLLQTEEYARTAVQASPGQAHDLDHLVTVRTRRKRVLDGQRPITMHVIVSEAALRNPLGGKDVFRDQLRHLSEWSATDHLTLQVLPFTEQGHPGFAHAFTILALFSFDAVHVELTSGDAYIEDKHGVNLYLRAFNHLRKAALTPAESNSFIAGAIDAL